MTPAVCELELTTVSFLSPGTCTLAVDQRGDSAYEAAQQATQSFTVAAPLIPEGQVQTLSFTSTEQPSGFTLAGSPKLLPDGAVRLTGSAAGSGNLSWLLTFANGSLGVIEGAVRSCGAGTIQLAGGCRPAEAIFAFGHAGVVAGRIQVTVRPGAAASVALRRARLRHRALRLVVLVHFQPAHGGTPYTRSLTLALRPSLH